MVEPQKMVHLTPAQIRRKKFNHPLTENASPPLTEEQLDSLLLIYFKLDSADKRYIEIRNSLVVNYFSLLNYIVARYLFHWPVTRRFLDEMISAGVEAIIKVITKLKPAQLEERNLVCWVEGAIRFGIETIVNDLRGIAPASRSTNFDRERVNKKPIYGDVVANLSSEWVKSVAMYYDAGLRIFEAGDAVEIIAHTKFERQVLAQENWSLTNAELGEKLNASSQHIGRVRKCLRDRYMKLGGKHV